MSELALQSHGLSAWDAHLNIGAVDDAGSKDFLGQVGGQSSLLAINKKAEDGLSVILFSSKGSWNYLKMNDHTIRKTQNKCILQYYLIN